MDFLFQSFPRPVSHQDEKRESRLLSFILFNIIPSVSVSAQVLKLVDKHA